MLQERAGRLQHELLRAGRVQQMMRGVSTISPSWSLYNIVVLPAASRPTINNSTSFFLEKRREKALCRTMSFETIGGAREAARLPGLFPLNNGGRRLQEIDNTRVLSNGLQFCSAAQRRHALQFPRATSLEAGMEICSTRYVTPAVLTSSDERSKNASKMFAEQGKRKRMDKRLQQKAEQCMHCRVPSLLLLLWQPRALAVRKPWAFFVGLHQ